MMQTTIRGLILAVPVLLISLPNPASATPNVCNQVREVRRLAIKADLDDSTLATLEYRYCGATQNQSSSSSLPVNATQNCIHLTVMARLARMVETQADLIRLVESQQVVACELLQQSPSSYWPNGTLVKSYDTWYYPNGNLAKSYDHWYYPNGNLVKSYDTWYYPNGNLAKSYDHWYYPNGNYTSSESLLAWACSIIQPQQCLARLSNLRKSQDFWRNLTIVELSWRADQAKRNAP